MENFQNMQHHGGGGGDGFADDGSVNIDLEPSDTLFKSGPERLIITGSSNSGKSVLCAKIVKKYIDQFQSIVLCGGYNIAELLQVDGDNEIKNKLYYTGSSEIFNPFTKFSQTELQKRKKSKLQTLIIYDDLQELVANSSVVSELFSKGRHFNFSVMLILQSYFPQGAKSKTVLPQIKANASVQIFTTIRSMREVGTIVDRLECTKDDKLWLTLVFKQVLVKGPKYRYLVVNHDASNELLTYSNNLFNEDGTPHASYYINKNRES